MWDALWSTLFPPRCVGCDRRGTPLCAACRRELPYLRVSLCARCALPRPLLGVCRGCRSLSAALESVRALCAFEAAARRAIHLFKFKSGRHLAPVLGELLREDLARRPIRAQLVVAVPMSAARRRARGYNQAELLAAQVAGPVGGQLRTDLLTREDRPAQQRLTAAERLLNLQGAIRCPRAEVARGQTVLLCDDVMTTGATLSACADALADAGARSIRGLVFARDL